MTRHTLEVKTIAQIKAAKRGQFCLIRDRYVSAMEKLGYTHDQARVCWSDVYDMALLEQEAA